jgi:hypothetical protein
MRSAEPMSVAPNKEFDLTVARTASLERAPASQFRRSPDEYGHPL